MSKHHSDNMYSLCQSQKRTWYAMKNAQVAHHCAAFKISGPLSTDSLKRSIERIVAEYPILKSTIIDDKQRIVRTEQETASSSSLVIHDLSHKAHQNPHLIIQSICNDEFDLASGPLYRFSLIKCNANDHFFVASIHPLIIDKRSFSLLLMKLSEYYNNIPSACNAQSFNQHYQAEEGFRNSQQFDKGILHWVNLLGDSEFKCHLPSSSTHNQLHNLDRPDSQLCPDLSQSVYKQAQLHNCSVDDILLGCYVMLLHRLSNKSDVLVNTSSDGQFEELPDIIGCTENQLAYRFNIDNNTNLNQCLQQVKPQTIRNHYFKNCSATDIVRAVREKLNDRFTGQFSNCDFERWQPPKLTLKQLQCELLDEYCTHVNPSDITLCYDYNDDNVISLFFNCAKAVDRELINQITHYYKQLLLCCCKNPMLAIGSVSLFDQQLAQEYTHNDQLKQLRDYPRNSTIDQVFDTICHQHSNKTAIIDGGTELSYAQLQQRSNQLASYLQSLHYSSNIIPIVGVYLQRGADAIVAILAILKAGLAYTPISSDYPNERISYILEDTDCQLIITSSNLSSELPNHNCQVIHIDELISANKYAPPKQQHNASSAAYIMYTSGSTGKPKGVIVSHRNIIRLVINNTVCPLNTDTIMAFASSIAFDAATLEIYGALLNGGSLVTFDKDTVLSSTQFQQQLTQNKINTLWMTVALFNQFASERPDMFASLDNLLVGGDALNAEMIHRVKTCPQGAPKRIINGYGPTETTTFAVCYNIPNQHSENTPIPIGYAIANTTCYVLNDTLQLVPHGFSGELYIGGDGVATGYLNRDDLTRERFIKNPFAESISGDYNQVLYRTGDLVRRDANGLIHFIGRVDNQIKIRGFRIELEEIEHVIAEHPMIDNAVVVVSSAINGDKSLAGFYIANGILPPTTLQKQLETQLPHYMIPETLTQVDQFPLTSNGKVDRKRLLNYDNSDQSIEVDTQAHVLPIIMSIFRQALRADANSVGKDSDFFELGGHSLKATQLVAYIRQNLKAELSVKDIFELRTPNALAHLIETKKRDAKPLFKLHHATAGELIPASFQMSRGWYLFQMHKTSRYYNLPFEINFEHTIDAIILREALYCVLAAHDIFNLHYAEHNDQLVLCQQPHQQRIEILSIANSEQLDDLREQQRLMTFNLEKNINHSATIAACRSSKRCTLFFNIHHNFFDGWSLSVFMRDLATAYQQLLTNQPLQLPQAQYNYQDYAYTQHQWSKNAAFEPQLDFWRQTLAGDLPILKMPTDYERPLEPTTNGDSVPISIDVSLAEKLRQIASSNGVSLFTLLLTAYAAFLHKYTEQEEIMIGTPIANRNLPDLENIVGCFVNTIAYRVHINQNDTVLQLLRSIHNYGLNASENQEVPFDVVAKNLTTEHQAGISYVFQTIFTFQSGISLSGDWEDGNSQYTVKQLPTDCAKCDLALVLYDMADGSIQGDLEFSCDLYRRETIETYVKHYVSLLQRLSLHLDIHMANLSLLTREQRLQLINQFRKQQPNTTVATTIDHRFSEIAATHAEITAVVDHECALTYAELDHQSNQCAHLIQQALFSQQYVPDKMIGLCIGRHAGSAVALLGILKSGCAFFLIDPAHPKARIETVIEQSKVALIITDNANAGLIKDLAPDINTLCLSEINSDTDSTIKQYNHPSDLAYTIFTSGSTGKPKGVLIEHSGIPLMAQALQPLLAPTPGCRCSQLGSLNFDGSLFEYFCTLLNGGTLIIADDNSRKDPQALIEFINRNAIEIIPFIPPAMLEVLPADQVSSNLKTLVIAGDSCAESAMQSWARHCTLINAYGPSEATICTTYHIYQGNDHSNNIGKPLDHIQTYVLDKHMNPQPPGIIGELYIGGDDVLARGYLDRNDLTINAFITNPFNDRPNSFLYKSGDLVKQLPDGNLIFIGRCDAQIKLRGFRIELGEIENVLNRHPDIQQVVVNVVELDALEYLVAHYVTAQPLSTEALRSYCRSMLPDYMTPNFFVAMQALPVTINGKVDRKALPKPEVDTNSAQNNNYSETANQLIAIWQKHLGPISIGLHDNFFQLGGNSFTSIRVLQAINEQFDCNISATAFMALPTVAALENQISSGTEQQNHNVIEQAIADAQLPDQFKAFKSAQSCQHILITGATGFVGCYLVQTALQQFPQAHITCLVRADNSDAATSKLKAAMQNYGHNDIDNQRVDVVLADLEQNKLGLDDTQWQYLANNIDCIIHNGAWVHHIVDYTTLKPANVDSTMSLLELCDTGISKQLHFISTLSAATHVNEHNKLPEVISSEKPTFTSGYLLTKWVSEQLVHQAQRRGLHACIYRLGNITGDSRNGKSNYHNNHSLLLLKGCLQLNSAPDWSIRLDLMPVDIAAQLVCRHIAKPTADCLHIANANTLRWQEYVQCMHDAGLELKLEPINAWQQHIRHLDESNAMFPFKNMYSDTHADDSEPPTADTTQTQLLYDSGMVETLTPTKLAQLYVDYLIKQGFFQGH